MNVIANLVNSHSESIAVGLCCWPGVINPNSFWGKQFGAHPPGCTSTDERHERGGGSYGGVGGNLIHRMGDC